MPTENLNRLINPISFLAVLLAAVVVFYGALLPEGTLNHGDEYLTLDRTHSFTLRDNWWAVYSENRPTFKKPPLQYWMGAVLLDAGMDLELALRLPSFIFAMGILLLSGWLARIMLPSNPWVFPVAVLLLACSKRFWENAMSALLDNGATFFATLALIATFAAIRQPRWWYLVALACGLGALQKAPIPFVFAAVALIGIAATQGSHRLPVRQSVRSGHFLLALILAVILAAAWPVLQWMLYGQSSFQEAYLDQMVERFSPFAEDRDKKPSIYSLLVAGEPLLRIPAILALFWLPWRLKRMEFVGLPVLFGAYVLVCLGASGIVSPRYSLMFLPMLMASLAAVLLTVLPDWKRQLAVVVVLCAINLGPLKTPDSLDIYKNSQAATVPLLQSVGQAIGPGETLIVCRRGEKGRRIVPGAISYYASAGKPFFRLSTPDQFVQLHKDGVIQPPYRVVCGISHYEDFSGQMTEVNVVETVNDFVHWTATDVRLDQ